jgi:hypothetical protein
MRKVESGILWLLIWSRRIVLCRERFREHGCDAGRYPMLMTFCSGMGLWVVVCRGERESRGTCMLKK